MLCYLCAEQGDRQARGGPAITRMIPSSSWRWSISRLPLRAASSAASLTRFARSAPTKPGVIAATLRDRRVASFDFCECGPSRIASRPSDVGTVDEDVPVEAARAAARRGRASRAGWSRPSRSRRCSRSKPSISTSSCVERLLALVVSADEPVPRVLPKASSSSMKMMQGDLASACWNMSRTRAAPTPTNISTKSEPDRLKNGTPASPAIALAKQRLAGPGRPDQQHALGNAPAQSLVLLRGLQELDDLAQLFDRLVDTRHVAEGRGGRPGVGSARATASSSPLPLEAPLERRSSTTQSTALNSEPGPARSPR